MALSPLLLGLSAVMGGVLQATKRFAAFAIAPMLYNIGIIFGIVCLAPAWGVRGVAVGVVLGTALHLLAQAIPVFRTRTLILDRPTYREPRIRRMLSLMGPRTAGLAITQLNLIVLLALASSLSDGSVSVLAFANNVQSVPLGLVGISFAVAALPALSQAAARRDTGETTRLVTTIARSAALSGT
jgi:putative peptidoglycan lipid II flippase